MVKTDLDLYDAHAADEAFVTSTSFCVCPVAAVNGVPFRERAVPGAMTKRLSRLYSEAVGFDFVAQYLKHLQ